MGKADYTFRGRCDVCDQQPILKDTGMCAVCTFGEADSMWEWLDDGVVVKESTATQSRLDGILSELVEAKIVRKNGTIDPIGAALMHIDQHVVDRIESLI